MSYPLIGKPGDSLHYAYHEAKAAIRWLAMIEEARERGWWPEHGFSDDSLRAFSLAAHLIRNEAVKFSAKSLVVKK